MDIDAALEDDGSTAPDDVVTFMEGWLEKFTALQDEAREYGIVSVVALASYDPLNKESWHNTRTRGDWFAALGLVTCMQREMLDGP